MMKNTAKKPVKEFHHTLKQLTQPSGKFPVAFENELQRLIREEAYSLAEQDGFKESPEHYWYTAEEKVYRNH
ncbi:MAG: DUF2934 domain-containing protein [Methylotenera sp.]|jgi:Protein of unknown function (DUF2934)